MSTWYRKYAESHPVTDVITGNDEGKDYLYRWALIPKNRFFNIYLHHFIGDDKRVLHDHPWCSLAYQLEGCFVEHYKRHSDDQTKGRVIEKGTWTFRRGSFLHYLTLKDTFGLDSRGAWSLFFTGPRFRMWGFRTVEGWKPYHEVLNYYK